MTANRRDVKLSVTHYRGQHQAFSESKIIEHRHVFGTIVRSTMHSSSKGIVWYQLSPIFCIS